MACHVAIVTQPYDQMILAGEKTIECRLTKTRIPPFGVIVPGERIYFKQSSGPFFATAIVDCVFSTDQLTPKRVVEIQKRWNDRIRGEAAFYQSRKHAAFASVIWLRQVQPTKLQPRYKPVHMRAWYTVGDEADPMAEQGLESPAEKPAGVLRRAGIEIPLTGGAIRNGFVSVAGCMDRFPADAQGGRTAAEAGRPITLLLHDGPMIETDIVKHRKMFRARGPWHQWFAQQKVNEGDVLRFTPLGRRRYEVSSS